MKIIQFINDHYTTIIAAGAFVISEVVSFIPSLKSNGLIQLLGQIFKK